ncbi:cupredoxin domain-containing protein [Synechococcus sp. RedBA-s]|uniref:cupredoxin domain-containing protein n=1 Tax=Synechococcus sp. RedBA-s TaxID=2823741 RepID=UPI0020CF7157|nr:cupredoxin domain-containing protein [Synechococcus sp. RedBA-s]MCP9800739.1 cupredoxin domain-containing protein [Synechococcus sp. RedBA-s]
MLILAATAPLWRTIDQPVALKGLVAMVGLLLIVWELWWFLGRHGGGVTARDGEAGVQEITITVDGGYAPSRFQVKAGRPLRLSFHRIDPSGCVAQVIFPDFHKTLDLPLEATTSLELPPTEAGVYPFHCGMNMVRGVLEVVDENANNQSAKRAS